MTVKRYDWPFQENPHTLLVQQDGEKWSAAICNANSHVFLTPNNPPEFIKLTHDKKIHKELLTQKDMFD